MRLVPKEKLCYYFLISTITAENKFDSILLLLLNIPVSFTYLNSNLKTTIVSFLLINEDTFVIQVESLELHIGFIFLFKSCIKVTFQTSLTITDVLSQNELGSSLLF